MLDATVNKQRTLQVRSGKEMQPSIQSTRNPMPASSASAPASDDNVPANSSWWSRKKVVPTEVRTWLVLVPLTNHSLKVTLLKNPPPPQPSTGERADS